MTGATLCSFAVPAGDAAQAAFLPVLAQRPEDLAYAAELQVVARRFDARTGTALVTASNVTPSSAIVVRGGTIDVIPHVADRESLRHPLAHVRDEGTPHDFDATLAIRGANVPVRLISYVPIVVTEPAHVVVWAQTQEGRVPWAVREGNALELDGKIDGAPHPLRDALLASVIDIYALRHFTQDAPALQIVFSNVDASTDPARLWRAVRLMAAGEMQYEIEAGGQPQGELRTILLFASAHGARVVSPHRAQTDGEPWVRGDLGPVNALQSQVETAKQLRFCSPCIASGLLDVNYLSFDDLRRYVAEMQRLGYSEGS